MPYLCVMMLFNSMPSIGFARGDGQGTVVPPRGKFGGFRNPYHTSVRNYIEPGQQLSYYLVLWISVALISTTKIFLGQHQTNTSGHLASDPKRCYLVVSTKSADHLANHLKKPQRATRRSKYRTTYCLFLTGRFQSLCSPQ